MRTCTRCGESKPLREFGKKSYRCKPCNVIASREWAEANPERARANRLLHKASQAARSARYYARNKEKMKARALAFDRANPERHRERVQRRRARLKGATVESVDYAEILRRDGDRCYLCGGLLGDKVDFDHVVPVARGGTHEAANIRVSHPSCNRRKGARLVSECDWAVVDARPARAV